MGKKSLFWEQRYLNSQPLGYINIKKKEDKYGNVIAIRPIKRKGC